MAAEREDVVAGMGDIISRTASFRNDKNAIGFSFHYYLTHNQICLLALNGVSSTKETVRDGSYPLASEFYAVTAAPIGRLARESHNTRLAALLDWILSSERTMDY